MSECPHNWWRLKRLEVAASVRLFELSVVVIESQELLLARVASPFLIEKITGFHKANGVQIYLNADPRVTKVDWKSERRFKTIF